MNITEFISRLKAYVESHTPNYQDGDAETLLEMLFNVYTEFNGFDNQIIREDFNNLYAAMNGKTLREMDQIIYPVCTLCRDHEKAGFIEGIKIGIPLSQELKNPCATKLRTCMVYSFRGYRFPPFRAVNPKLPDSSATAGNT